MNKNLQTFILVGVILGGVRAESVELKPFPELSAPRAVTAGPHDHFLANYFAINAWSPDNRYLLVLETDVRDRLPDGAPCTLGLVDTEDGNRFIPVTTTRCWNFQEAAMAHWMPCEEDYPRQVGGREMNFDGHCIYSPDGNFISGDGYWDENFNRHWKMVCLADNKVKDIGSFFVPEPYRDIYCRCDLHPRWRPDGKQIGFNSVYEGSRQVYVMDVKGE